MNAVGKVTPASGSTTINCFTNSPANCLDTAATGTIVLEAASVENATFTGWVGCANPNGAQCTLDLTTSKTVTANFSAATQALTVKTYPIKTATVTPPYGGKLTAATTPAIDCGRTAAADVTACATSAAAGSSVVLTAVPLAGSKVQSWSGCTSSTATTCTVAMNAAKVVSATFGSLNVPVTAQVSGPGTITSPLVAGAVTDAITCGSDCSGQVVPGQNITFTATAASGAMLVGWTGCSSATTTCTLTNVTAPVTVTATFKSTNCSSCHGVPSAATHAAFSGTCTNCHPGYAGTVVDPTKHMNGVHDYANTTVAPPATFGFNVEIVGFQPFADATYARGYIDLKVTDGTGTALDLISLINTCQTYSGTATGGTCDGSNRTARVSIGQIQADGSFRPVLRGSTGNVASSETIATARLTDQGGNVYRYQPQYGFLAAVAYDATKDYRAVVYGGRYFKAPNQPAVPFYNSDFADLQGTGTVRASETVNDAACNGCHGKLTLHGMRRGVAICLSCHNANTPLGSGNTDTFKWDLKNLVHKLHSGKNYGAVGVNPTKPDGTTGSPWGTTMDASHMAMGPSHSTYMDGGTDPGIMGAECGICHQGANAAYAYSRPTRLACGSCHDDVNFATGAGHNELSRGSGIVQTDDSLCALCHNETTVRRIHSPFYDSANNVNFASLSDFPATGHVLQVKITNVEVDANGLPTITIDAKYKNGAGNMVAADLKTWIATVDSQGAFRLPTCAFTIAGPTSDYTFPTTGSTALACAAGATSSGLVEVTAGVPGVYEVSQLGTGFFAGKTGAYTVSFEIMMARVATKTGGFVRKPFSADPNFFTVVNTGTAADPVWVSAERGSGSTNDLAYSRRAIVTYEKCNACHVDIGFHSNRNRQGPDYCAMCHNPKLDNGTRARVKAADAYTTAATGSALVYLPESVSMNVFIHRIHMGSRLPSVQNAAQASPWVPEPGKIVYGATRSNFPGNTATTAPSLADLSAFTMPNAMGRCNQCHIDGTWALPTTAGLAPIERTMALCNPVTVSWDAEQWCGVAASGNSGMPKYDADPDTAGVQPLTIVTPPIKAACTSCHDDLATDAHVNSNTVNPMTSSAVESCAKCHGASAPWDVLRAHPAIP